LFYPLGFTVQSVEAKKRAQNKTSQTKSSQNKSSLRKRAIGRAGHTLTIGIGEAF
jgi:hypothetical protein